MTTQENQQPDSAQDNLLYAFNEWFGENTLAETPGTLAIGYWAQEAFKAGAQWQATQQDAAALAINAGGAPDYGMAGWLKVVDGLNAVIANQKRQIETLQAAQTAVAVPLVPNGQALLDALLEKIDDAYEEWERRGAVCYFEEDPMIHASTLIDIAYARNSLIPALAAQPKEQTP